MSGWVTVVRVRFKRCKWACAVYYGGPKWPSYSFWIAPGTLRDMGS